MTKKTFLYLLGGIFSLIIAMGIGRFVYTPILPLMQKDLSFSDSIAGYLASMNYAGYFVGAVLAGALPLKSYRTVALRTSLIVSLLTTFCMGVSHSYLWMFLIRFLSGLSSAFIFVFASSIVLDQLAQEGKTNWSGLFYSGVGLGIFTSSIILSCLDHVLNWQWLWIVFALFCTILTIFVWKWLKDPSPLRSPKGKQDQHSAWAVPPKSWLPVIMAAYGLEGFGYIVTGTFIVSIAEKTYTFSLGPSIVWLVVGLAAAPSCIIWSFLAKKWGFVRSLFCAMTLQAFGIAIPVFWLSKMSMLLSALLFGGTFMGITTLATTLSRQISPKNSNQIIGYLTAIYGIGQMIGPSISGLLLDYTNSYQTALITASSSVFTGAVLLLSGLRFEKGKLLIF